AAPGGAGGLAAGLQPQYFATAPGRAPIITIPAAENRFSTIAGRGPGQRALDRHYFMKNHGGKIPQGIMRTVVPAAPDAWITALERFGTMSFADVAKSAISYARDGFPTYDLMNEVITDHEAEYRKFPSNVDLYLPN